MIVGARLKAGEVQALAIGWHSRNLHYVKTLQPLSEYLKPAPTVHDKRAKGATDLKRMFDRLAAKD